MDKKTLKRANDIAEEVADLRSLYDLLHDIGKLNDGCRPIIQIDCYETSARATIAIRSEDQRNFAFLLSNAVSGRIAELERQFAAL